MTRLTQTHASVRRVGGRWLEAAHWLVAGSVGLAAAVLIWGSLIFILSV